MTTKEKQGFGLYFLLAFGLAWLCQMCIRDRQVERTGVHSGDSICVYPAQHLTQAEIDTMVDYTGRFARELHVNGLVNVQYAVSNGKVYVIEVNPRSSRTVPYISKVTGVPMVDLAVRCCLGEKLADMGYGTGLHPNAPYVAVKVPVFSFEKPVSYTHLGK